MAGSRKGQEATVAGVKTGRGEKQEVKSEGWPGAR